MNIKSSSALRNSYNTISAYAKETQEPVFITVNGEGDGVFMSMDSYEYGIDGSIEFPRLIAPFFGGNNPRMTEEKVRRAVQTGQKIPNIITSRTTLAKASTNVIRRPGYYKMHVVGGEWTYRWKTLRAGSHEF